MSTAPIRQVIVVAIGDPHFKVSNSQETDEMVLKLIPCLRSLRECGQLDLIVCLGDILDRHETIHVSPLVRSTVFLKLLSEIAPLYVLIGNHDRPNNSDFMSESHPFNSLKHWPNTVVVDRTVDAIIHGHRFVFVPYVPPGRFDDALSSLQPSEGQRETAIFAHQEFYGAKMGAVTSIAGDPWPIDRPLVISGHIHDYDELQPNLIYVGTPMQHAFGDRSDKTVSKFTFKVDRTFESERIDLDLKKRIVVHLTVPQIESYSLPANRIVKVIVMGTSAEIKVAMRYPKIKELTRHGAKIVYKAMDQVESEAAVDSPEGKPQKFLDRLYSYTESDPEQQRWIEQLFGSRSNK